MTHTLIQQSPIIALGTCLYIVGALFNSPFLRPTESEIKIGTDLPCKNSANANLTQLLVNLTLDSSSSTIKTPIIIGLSAALSLVPIFLSGTKFNSAKTNALSSLGLGHAATFGTSETMKHFLIKPDDIFLGMCQLPYEVCVAMKDQIMHVLGKQSNKNLTEPDVQKCILPDFDAHLHSMPNICLGLLAASTTAFVFNIFKFKQMSANPIRAQTIKIKLALLFSFVILLFCIIGALFETTGKNMSDHFLSIAYGTIVQFFICFLLDKKPDDQNLNQ